MPHLVRPHIPLAVRVEVAERQYRDKMAGVGFPKTGAGIIESLAVVGGIRLRLNTLLQMLFDEAVPHLDHDPPLGARKKVFKRGVHVDYDPSANDPNHLIYRDAAAHRVKTNVRGDHGQHPDRVLIKKNRRLERGTKSKAKKRWPYRPLHGNTRWPPKGSRKIQARTS